MSSTLKKTVGTLVLAFTVLAGTAFAMPSSTFAVFINSVFGLVADGVVLDINNSNLTLLTNGTDPIDIKINNRTRVIGNPGDGDSVKVIARSRNGEVTARIIKKTNTGPYGTSGDSVVVSKAKVVSKTDYTLTVESNAAIITFLVNPQTRFVRKGLSELMPGDEVKVIGRDNGADFYARIVHSRRGGGHGGW